MAGGDSLLPGFVGGLSPAVAAPLHVRQRSALHEYGSSVTSTSVPPELVMGGYRARRGYWFGFDGLGMVNRSSDPSRVWTGTLPVVHSSMSAVSWEVQNASRQSVAIGFTASRAARVPELSYHLGHRTNP